MKIDVLVALIDNNAVDMVVSNRREMLHIQLGWHPPFFVNEIMKYRFDRGRA